MYIYQAWPRDLIHKATGKRQDFKRPEDVPPGWFTVDGEEVNPSTLLRDELQKRQAVVDRMLEDTSGPTPEPEAKTRRRKPSEKVDSDGN